MSSLNLVQFIGNVGKIETRFMQDGKAVTSLSIACNHTWKDKTTGQKQERCEWINIVMYGKLAEIAQEYVTKGMQIYVSGKMKTTKWQDKSGQDRYATNIVANEMKMLGSKSKDSGNQEQKPRKPDDGGFDEMEDSIPF